MMKRLILAALCASGLSIAATGPSLAADDADKASYEKSLAAAKEAQKKAASVGGEWRDVGSFIKDAEKAAEGGDYKTALKMSKRARVQGELGYEQAMEQKNAKMEDYIK